MRPIQWHLKQYWRVPESLKRCYQFPGRSTPFFKLVAGGKQYAPRASITPTTTCTEIIYRRIRRRLGHSLKRSHCKGTWSLPESKLHITGTKSGPFGPKRVPRPLPKQHSSYSHRQHHSGCLGLNKKEGWSRTLCEPCYGVSWPGVPASKLLSKPDTFQAGWM